MKVEKEKKRRPPTPHPPKKPCVENYSLCDGTVLRVIGTALHQTALPTWLRWDSWQRWVAVAQINTVSIKISHIQLWYNRNITATSRYSVNVIIQKLTQNVQVHSENGSDTPRGACGNQVNLSICWTTNTHFLRRGTSGGVYGPCIFTPMLAESYHRWLKVFANGFVWRLLGDNKLPCLLILFPSLLILHRHAVPSSGFSSSFFCLGVRGGGGD